MAQVSLTRNIGQSKEQSAPQSIAALLSLVLLLSESIVGDSQFISDFVGIAVLT